MNITEINRAIIQGNLTNEELNSIMESVQFARAQLGRSIKRNITVGANVSFVSNRNGQKYLGRVDKVSIKNVIVRTAVGVYRVPANMLELV